MAQLCTTINNICFHILPFLLKCDEIKKDVLFVHIQKVSFREKNIFGFVKVACQEIYFTNTAQRHLYGFNNAYNFYEFS